MLAAMLAFARPYGFFGIQGLFGILIGLIVMVVVCGILWRIFTLLATKFQLDGTWVEIAKLVLTLLVFLWFISYIFGFWAP